MGTVGNLRRGNWQPLDFKGFRLHELKQGGFIVGVPRREARPVVGLVQVAAERFRMPVESAVPAVDAQAPDQGPAHAFPDHHIEEGVHIRSRDETELADEIRFDAFRLFQVARNLAQHFRAVLRIVVRGHDVGRGIVQGFVPERREC